MNSVCLLLESSTTVGSRSWDLDTLGNWLETGFDLTGDGDFGDTDELQDRTHNLANELLTASKTFEPFGSALTYDPSGNLKQEARTVPGTPLPVQYDINYVHDAWNRLISVTRQPGSLLRGSYEYNGLNWRTLRRYDSGPTQATAVDDERIYYYSAAWQVLEEHVDEGFATSPGVDRVVQQVWGVRYIDDAVLRRVDRNADGDFADGGDGIFFMATDVQFSVVAVLDDAGVLHERVAYSPYGRGEHRWGGDVNGDGSVDNYDLLAIATAAEEAIGDAGYQADLDVDRDGRIFPSGVTEDLVRVQAFGSRVAVPTGWISDPADTAGPDNEVGYAGYRFNCEDQMYCVRFRHYSPRLGRWIERDPAGYVDTSSLYGYVSSDPVSLYDPLGLFAPETESVSGCGGSVPYYYQFNRTLSFYARSSDDASFLGMRVDGESYDSLEAALATLHKTPRATDWCQNTKLRLDLSSHGEPGILKFHILDNSEEYLSLALLREIQSAIEDPCSVTDCRRDTLNRMLDVLYGLFGQADEITLAACNVGCDWPLKKHGNEENAGTMFILALENLGLICEGQKLNYWSDFMAHPDILWGYHPFGLVEAGGGHGVHEPSGYRDRQYVPKCECDDDAVASE